MAVKADVATWAEKVCPSECWLSQSVDDVIY